MTKMNDICPVCKKELPLDGPYFDIWGWVYCEECWKIMEGTI